MLHGSLVALIVAVSCTASAVRAQTYTYSQSVGQQAYTANIRPSGALIMSGPADNMLSSWQTLPFTWSFYGAPISGYFASDNGYITFDASATASVPGNIAAADPAQPNNAIYAYWEDLHFTGGQPSWSNEIRTITIGTAPNRAHVIMWVSAVPPGVEWSSNNSMSFAIALKESGGFDIIYIAGRKTVRDLTGSVGCENAAGTLSTWVAGSPAIDYPTLTAAADDDVSYHFDYSANQYDLTIVSSTLPRQAKQNTPLGIGGTLKNLGTAAMQSFTLHYAIDEDAPVSMPVTGLSLLSNDTYDFTITPSWTTPPAGSFHAVRIWADNLNETVQDQNTVNDTLTAPVFIITGATLPRRVLVEEFTGAWCGWCPDGGLQIQDIETLYPSAIAVAIHAGGIDAMRTEIGDSLAAMYKPSYPQAMVDRVRFPGQTTVPISRSGSAWKLRTAERELVPSPVSLAVHADYDSSSRQATVTVDARYVDFGYPGDTRLNVLVAEDHIVGSGVGYDQANYYSHNSSYPNHPYYGESNPILGFVHRHVLRGSLTGIPGDGTAIPAAPQAGQTYSMTLQYAVPESFNAKEISFVAFLASIGPDLADREVINAGEAPLIPKPTSVDLPATLSTPEISLYPNPATDLVTVNVRLPSMQRMHLVLHDAVGREVMTIADGEARAGLFSARIRPPHPGLYWITASTGEAKRTRPLLILE